MNDDDEFISELRSLLKDFIIQFVHVKPDDVLSFSVEYFNNLYQKKCLNESLSFYGKKSTGSGGSILSALPTMMFNVPSRRRAMSAEYYLTDQHKTSESFIPNYEKDRETIEKITESIKSIFLFQTLNDYEVNLIVSNMFERKTRPGEIVIEKGNDGKYFYIVGQGIYEVYIMNNKEPICIKSLHGEGYFGEVSLMYDCLRVATVISKTNGIVYGLDKKTFKDVVSVKAFEKRRKCYEVLRNIDIFMSLGEYELNHMADLIIRRTYNTLECIMLQGEIADEMYIIESGEVLITRSDDHMERNLFYLHPGDYFGELAFVTNQTQPVSAHAFTDVEVMVITKIGLERLLGPCLSIIRKNLNRNKYM